VLAGRFSSSIGLVGIDFGSHGAKLLQLGERSGDLYVVGAARVTKPAGRWEDVDHDHLVKELRAAFASGGFTGRRCAVSLPRSKVSIQSVRLPSMPDAEIRSAAAWEAADRFDLNREAMEVDFLRTGAALQSGDSREEIILAAAPHETISALLDPVLAAGLRPVAVDTDFAAQARTVGWQRRRGEDSERVVAVVEVGASGSTIMILRGDQIAFCKPLAIGGEHFTRAVAEHLQLDERSAWELRAARIAAETAPGDGGPGADPSTSRAVFEAVRPLMGELVKEVMLCLRYYGVTFRGRRPEHLILTGGDGLEPKLDGMLAQSCHIQVVFEDTASMMGKLIGQIQTILNRVPGPSACWGVAAGLSLRGIANGRRVGRASARRRKNGAQVQHSLDLLPGSIRARSLAGLRTGRLVGACLLAIIILVALTTHSRIFLNRARANLETVQGQADLVLAADAQAHELRSELHQIQQYIARYRRIAVPLETSRVLASVINALPPSVTLERISLEVGAHRLAGSSRRNNPANDGGEDRPVGRSLTGTVAGFAATDQEIAELVAAMGAIPPFRDVSLDFSRTRSVRDKPAREFRLSFWIDLDRPYEVLDMVPKTAAAPEELGHVE
jgi:type IV pilus assembly protein PilM